MRKNSTDVNIADTERGNKGTLDARLLKLVV